MEREEIIYIFELMGNYSRIVWYRGKMNAWGRREQCHLYKYPLNL
jgi:hypothetical protein